MPQAISLREKLRGIDKHWTPGIVAALNDYHVKLVKIQGEFTWHSHAETDELFLVLHGKMTILLHDGEVSLADGDLYVVPKGVEHKPVAENECHVLLLEPAGTLNTGDTPGEFTVEQPLWI
ncbi:MAG: cupin domain-containing protein [Gammaproteobacteria bacterium]|nr:cupin domain-containing protein [Gammaproteobacteria bacterium]MDH3767684.1 cupin domain-containing protein [Gammaproteobacteria bacterium]